MSPVYTFQRPKKQKHVDTGEVTMVNYDDTKGGDCSYA